VTLSVDVGGSSVKAMKLDAAGRPLTERLKRPTPRPALPRAVVETIVTIADELGAYDRVSVGFPGVIRDGHVLTAVNLDGDWDHFDLEGALEKRLGKDVRVLNDAAIQGFGAIQGDGVELTVTLGTGFGSSMFVNGMHTGSLELGHHAFRKGETYEQQLGERTLEAVGKKRWKKRLKLAIAQLQRVFWPDHLYLGGGNARLVDWKLPRNVKVVSNECGILGGIALWRLPRPAAAKPAKRSK
jgi:polyphosphate glucokinase